MMQSGRMGWDGHMHAWRDEKLTQHFVRFKALTAMSIEIRSSGMCRCSLIDTNVSEEPAASVFRVGDAFIAPNTIGAILYTLLKLVMRD
jgi:hypothetical protein